MTSRGELLCPRLWGHAWYYMRGGLFQQTVLLYFCTSNAGDSHFLLLLNFLILNTGTGENMEVSRFTCVSEDGVSSDLNPSLTCVASENCKCMVFARRSFTY